MHFAPMALLRGLATGLKDYQTRNSGNRLPSSILCKDMQRKRMENKERIPHKIHPFIFRLTVQETTSSYEYLQQSDDVLY